MTFTLKGILFGFALFATIFVTFLVFTLWRIMHLSLPAPGGGQPSLDLISLFAHLSYVSVLLVLLTSLIAGCRLATPRKVSM
jgi:hypothetical protein